MSSETQNLTGMPAWPERPLLPRNVYSLGIIRWVYENARLAQKLKVNRLNIDSMFSHSSTPDIAFHAFCDLVSGEVTPAELEQLGREALEWRFGCSLKVDEQSHRIIADKRVAPLPVLRKYSCDWKETDGTHMMSVSIQSEEDRYTNFPTFRRNSCAPDSVLAASIFLNAGRCKLDQMSTRASYRIGRAPACLRSIVCSNWAETTQYQKNKLRDMFVEQLELDDPIKFKMSKFMAISDILTHCFSNLPQTTFTAARLSYCCDKRGQFQVRTSADLWRDVTRYSVLAATPAPEEKNWPLAEAINYFFEPNDFRLRAGLRAKPCSAGPGCTGVRGMGHVVVDRLPPTLVVTLPERVTLNMNGRWRCFDSVRVRAVGLGSESPEDLSKWYEAVGCVCFVNDNHFILRWLRHERLHTYDDMHKAGVYSSAVSEVDGPRWFEGTAYRMVTVVAVFFTECEAG